MQLTDEDKNEQDIIDVEFREVPPDSPNGFDGETYVEGDDIFYSTGELADILHVNRDMIRIHINDFSEYLNISRSKTGKGAHTKLSSKDVQLLDTIIKLRKTRSVPETKEILDAPDMAELMLQSSRGERQLANMLLENNAVIMNQLSALLEDNNKKALEEAINQQKAFTEELLKQQQEAHNAETEGFLNEIRELNEKVEQLSLSVKELSENKNKRGLFGFLKK